MQSFEHPFRSLLVQRDQWDTYWGPKKDNFLIAPRTPRHGARVVESCQFLPRVRPGAA